MASGGHRVVTGAYIGTGAALSIQKVGYKPSAVQLINEDDPGQAWHSDTMPAASLAKQVDGTSSFVTSNGITLTDSGFDIGTDADFNVDGERVHFIAWE